MVTAADVGDESFYSLRIEDNKLVLVVQGPGMMFVIR